MTSGHVRSRSQCDISRSCWMSVDAPWRDEHCGTNPTSLAGYCQKLLSHNLAWHSSLPGAIQESRTEAPGHSRSPACRLVQSPEPALRDRRLSRGRQPGGGGHWGDAPSPPAAGLQRSLQPAAGHAARAVGRPAAHGDVQGERRRRHYHRHAPNDFQCCRAAHTARCQQLYSALWATPGMADRYRYSSA